MELVFFTHPSFLGSKSMPRFAKMLTNGMAQRGHTVEVLSPKARLFRLAFGPLKKWMGYLDQYVLFPVYVRKQLKKHSKKTLYVFTDHALGPWVHLVNNRPNVIHCHDFLAQQSGIGTIKENPVSYSGRQYQRFIYRGYSKGKNFISVSKKTQTDLMKFLPYPPLFSKVVYNGLDSSFVCRISEEEKKVFFNTLNLSASKGFILHVGGNQWYKNRKGVIEIYNAFRDFSNNDIALLMIGAPPSPQLIELREKSIYRENIHILTGRDDAFVKLAYSAASVFLFPSLAEGFGWPIAEAMASGCPVITTNEAPMTEVAGNAAFFIPRMPYDELERKKWAREAADIVNYVLLLPIEERAKIIDIGFSNIERFDMEKTIVEIEKIYEEVLNNG